MALDMGTPCDLCETHAFEWKKKFRAWSVVSQDMTILHHDTSMIDYAESWIVRTKKNERDDEPRPKQKLGHVEGAT